MKKQILLILVLMSLCVAGIVGLQLFWNYQNYQSTVRAFDHDVNQALAKAVDTETEQRRVLIVERFKGWLADTSLVTITADHNNRDSATVFYTQDTHPKFTEDKNRKSEFGIRDFHEKLYHITPSAKAFMIEHFGERILKRDLRDGVVYHYTQMLGDSLEQIYSESKMNRANMGELFKKELTAKNIITEFIINPVQKKSLYLTRAINTNFRKPYKKDFVYAGIESPDTYFLRQMKWVIITSLLLIIITIGCFIYTVKILLSQDKLAELKNAFINNITHELNTPIASIKITAEALKLFKHLPEKQNEYLDIIAYQTDKLNELTSQILNTGSLKDKNQSFEEIDLHTLVCNAIQDVRPQIENRDAVINYQSPEKFIRVLGQRQDLCNMLVNLLDNALKYTVEDPVILISLTQRKGHAIITIADNGIGIAKEFHDSIFDPFFRVPEGDLHNVKGFGLGLAFVKEVIKQHDGEIEVSSTLSLGCTFTIKLPTS